MLGAIDLAKDNLPERHEPVEHRQCGVLGAERCLGLGPLTELAIEIFERVRCANRFPRRLRELVEGRSSVKRCGRTA